MRKGSITPLNINPGLLPMEFVESLTNSMKSMPHLNVPIIRSSSLLNMARTKNVQDFLDSDAEWAFQIDSDMVWLPRDLIRLTKTAKKTGGKVVSGLAFMEQKGRIVPHAYSFVPTEPGRKILAPYAVLPSYKTPFTVEAAGGACLLVHREVYEAVYNIYKDRDTAYYWHEEEYMPVAGKMQGEDITFSKRVREAGYDIYYDPQAFFGHLAKGALVGVKEHLDFLDSQGIDPTKHTLPG